MNHKFTIDKVRGYVIVGLYPDTGLPGEIFIHLHKVGTELHGFADAWATLFSIALQYGVPLKVLIEKSKHVKFAPAGVTGNKDLDLRFADSVIDYVVRWMEKKFLCT